MAESVSIEIKPISEPWAVVVPGAPLASAGFVATVEIELSDGTTVSHLGGPVSSEPLLALSYAYEQCYDKLNEAPHLADADIPAMVVRMEAEVLRA